MSVSSAAFRRPELINELVAECGAEKVVVAIDVDRSATTASGYEVFIDGGTTATGADALEWAKEAERRGAGIILPTSKTFDGAKKGFDIPLIEKLKAVVKIPIVASGGAGTPEHFLEAAQAGADILLGASVFHFGMIKVSELKQYLTTHGIDVADA